MLQSSVQISRLKGFFRSGMNYSNYDNMLSITKRKALGSIPTDILFCVTSNGENKKSAILFIEKILNEAVEILGEINTLERQTINRMSINTPTERIMHFFQKDKIKSLFRIDSLYKEKEIETIVRAEEKILTGFKKYVPSVNNVVITPLDGGMYGNAYKLQVFDKDRKQIFNDKVLKVYRENHLKIIFQQRRKRYIDSLSDKKLVEKNNIENEKLRKLGIFMPEKTATKIRQEIQANLDLIEASEKKAKSIHGAMAETNTAEFLRFFSGHKILPEEGIAIPSYFGLGKTKFSLNEFIDKKRKAIKEFNFKRLCLEHSDFDINEHNGINGICIDIGGIIPIKNLIQGKGNIRILKSLLNCPRDKRNIVLEKYKNTGIISEETFTQIKMILKYI